jgi:hypothetical protein
MPKYHCAALSAQRWGIYYDDRLLATVGDRQEARQMLSLLKSRQKGADQVEFNSVVELSSLRTTVKGQKPLDSHQGSIAV